MTTDTPRITSDEIRYQGKAVHDEQWILDFLDEQQSGVLGLVDSNEPHLVTQLFVYNDDDNAIYLHGGEAGVAYKLVAADQPVTASFTTSSMGRYIPAEQPANFTVEYASVVAKGTIRLINNAGDKREVLEQVMEKYAPHLKPGEDYDVIRPESIDRTAVYQFKVDSWSAKKGEKDSNHPGAYDLE